jgi:hypothetical protein
MHCNAITSLARILSLRRFATNLAFPHPAKLEMAGL